MFFFQLADVSLQQFLANVDEIRHVLTTLSADRHAIYMEQVKREKKLWQIRNNAQKIRSLIPILKIFGKSNIYWKLMFFFVFN